MRHHVSPDRIRAKFSAALSIMYKQEVPLYADLLEIVQDVNRCVAARDQRPRLAPVIDLDDYTCEPHGAIRLGTPAELFALRRVFGVMGMFAVGYYDLAVAGVPVHSTAFRPIAQASLDASPLRIFTSLLRLDLIEDENLRAQAADLLASRSILSAAAMDLVAQAEQAGGLTEAEADRFVAEVLETFRWHDAARVTAETYDRLIAAHRLVADVVAFKGPHINHLTPRTLDIDAVQAEMVRRGIKAKATVEGPPRRQHAILLRQTSFQALSETIRFVADAGGEGRPGAHTARFGEVEQRGIALTPKGHALYDALLAQVRDAGATGDAYVDRLGAIFAQFPDDLDRLRQDGLAYFRYDLTPKGELAVAARLAVDTNLDACMAEGLIAATPLVYEDFLPVSAAGIFQSNLGGAVHSAYAGQASQADFEQALGEPVRDPFELYARVEAESRACAIAELSGVPA
jgi:uncharacterized glyoxalase superfamily metalloenzyme YdcJ